MPPAVKDLTQKVFGRLTVVRESAEKAGQKYWLCRCLCGVEKPIRGSSLRGGYTVSCGCFHREQVRRVDGDQVERMLRDGSEVEDVAATLGIHRQSVIVAMKRRGVSIADMKFGLKKTPSESDILYTAGIFDGEGTIAINRNKSAGGGPRWWLLASVANTDMRLHNWLQQTFGGHIRVNSRKNPARPCYHWTLTSRQAADFLRLLRPFLKIKGEQADIGLEFQSLVQGERNLGRANRQQKLKERLQNLR